MLDECEVVPVVKVSNMGGEAGCEVVEADYVGTLCDEDVAYPGAEEAGAAGDQHTLACEGYVRVLKAGEELGDAGGDGGVEGHGCGKCVWV